MSKQELHDLYCRRWQVELDLRAIKTVMQRDVLRCKSPQMVKKEIAVHLLADNLVRAVMAQAAHLGQLLSRQLRFKAALQLLRAFEENMRHCPRGQLANRRAYLLAGMAQLKLPHRPGRGSRARSSDGRSRADCSPSLGKSCAPNSSNNSNGRWRRA